MKPFVTALDGPAASGKSSVGLGTARELGYGYFDTGLLYRVLTWLALSQGVDPSDGAALPQGAGTGLQGQTNEPLTNTVSRNNIWHVIAP